MDEKERVSEELVPFLFLPLGDFPMAGWTRVDFPLPGPTRRTYFMNYYELLYPTEVDDRV